MSGDAPQPKFDPIMPWPVAHASREISEPEAILAAEHINSRTSLPTDLCQVCASKDVVIQPALFPIPLPPHIQTADGRLAFAHVMTICYNCGFTRLFNATVLGLTPLPDNEATASNVETAHG
jgi:hypothetical protein